MKIKFKYDRLKINTDDPKKWYISYTIKFNQPFSYNPGKTKAKSTHYIKCYGGEYAVRLNDVDIDERGGVAEKLLKRVKKSLDLQQDPKFNLEREGIKQMADAQLFRGVPYDEGVKLMVKYYNWDNPNPSSVITANNSMIFFRAAFRKFVKSINKLDDIREITSEDIEKWLLDNNESGKWAINTCISKISMITCIFIPLVDKKLIDKNPCHGLLKIKSKLKRFPQKAKKKRFEVWTDEELEEFHKIADCDEHRFFYTIGMTCYHSFIRRSEMLRLKLEHLQIDRKRWAINSNLTKGARKYDVDTILYLPMPKPQIAILETYLEFRFGDDRNPDYYLFPSLENPEIDYVYNYYNKNFTASLGYLLSHDKMNYALKHTGVSHFWREQTAKGIPVAMVLARLQKMCRHADIAETMTYLTTELGIELDGDIFD